MPHVAVELTKDEMKSLSVEAYESWNAFAGREDMAVLHLKLRKLLDVMTDGQVVTAQVTSAEHETV